MDWSPRGLSSRDPISLLASVLQAASCAFDWRFWGVPSIAICIASAVFAAHISTAYTFARISEKERRPLHKWRLHQPLPPRQSAHACRISLLCSRCGPGMTSRTTSLRSSRPVICLSCQWFRERFAPRIRWFYLRPRDGSRWSLRPRTPFWMHCATWSRSATVSARRGPEVWSVGT